MVSMGASVYQGRSNICNIRFNINYKTIGGIECPFLKYMILIGNCP